MDILRKHTDWFIWMKNYFIDGASMSWKFIKDSLVVHIPYVNETICTSSGYSFTIRRPCATKKILFKIMLMSSQCLYATIGLNEWSNIPNTNYVCYNKNVKPINIVLNDNLDLHT